MKQRLRHYWQYHKELVCIIITTFILVAGVAQYAFGLGYILTLTPLVISVMTALVVLFWQAPPQRRAALFFGAFLVGMIVEIIGINTHVVFGDYAYGTVLGLKIAGVPVLIGITWALVTIAAWQLVSLSNFGKVANIFLAAGVVVMFDLLLEQYATAFGLWAWQDGIIPLKNYATWLVVSLGLIALYSQYARQQRPSLYGASALPMMSLYFWLMLLVR